MLIDIYKPLYCIDKDTGEKHNITAIFFPLGKESGKDITIDTGESDEWRAIDEVEILNNTTQGTS